MLAKTPPMGWNSWNTFAQNINEEMIMQTADAMVETGLAALGYEYVVIDDCWSLRERGADGRIVADPEKFPHGMKYLADYVHSKGLKFGMYSCAGTRTCAEYPASFEKEMIDAQTFADWGVDFLKYDFCNKPVHANGPLLYYRMSMALKASGREILFSACNWGSDNVERWIRSTGAHMYRSTGDIGDNFQSIKDIALSQIDKLGYSTPGCFNDMDMLVCGMYNKGNVARGGCDDTEYKTHFALWCMCASALMIGCDVRNMTPETAALLKNPELIALNQDPEARAPFAFVRTDDGQLALFRHLANNEYALGIFNLSDRDRNIFCNFYDVGLSNNMGLCFEMKDMFTGEVVRTNTDYYRCPLKAHDCALYRAKLVKA